MSRKGLVVCLVGLLLLTGCGRESSQLAVMPLDSVAPAGTSQTTIPESAVTPLTTTTVAPTTAASTKLTPTLTVTPVPSPTNTLPTPTAAATYTITPIPFAFQDSIGVSIGGRDLRHYRLGFGPEQIVLVGALHGGHECNTRDVLEAIHDRLLAAPELIPDEITLHILPEINIDGCLLDTRENARVVDLNRNWNTPDWQTDAYGPSGFVSGSGGDVPFSEPETYHLKNWLLQLKAEAGDPEPWVITYHSAVPPNGLVLPSYLANGTTPQAAYDLGQLYSDQTGYGYSDIWIGGYTITGELAFWLGINGFVGIDVELPDRQVAEAIPAGWTTSHIDTNWSAILAVFELFSDQ